MKRSLEIHSLSHWVINSVPASKSPTGPLNNFPSELDGGATMQKCKNSLDSVKLPGGSNSDRKTTSMLMLTYILAAGLFPCSFDYALWAR